MDQLAYRPQDAAKVIGLSRSSVYEFISSGDLPSIRIGRARLVLREDLTAFLERQRTATPAGA